MSKIKRRWDLIILSILGGTFAMGAAVLSITGHQDSWDVGKVDFRSPVIGAAIIAACCLGTHLIIKKKYPPEYYHSKWAMSLIINLLLIAGALLFITPHLNLLIPTGVHYDIGRANKEGEFYDDKYIGVTFGGRDVYDHGFISSLHMYEVYSLKTNPMCIDEECSYVECESFYKYSFAGFSFSVNLPLYPPFDREAAKYCKPITYEELMSRKERRRDVYW